MEFKTMNITVAILCLKGTFGSKSASKLHWPSHKHSAHYAGSLSNTEWVLKRLWRTKCINQALSTSTGHACSVEMALVKLDPWGLLNSVFQNNTRQRGRTGYHWPLNSPAALKACVCLFDARVSACACLPPCACIWFIVWSFQSLIP